MVNVCAKASYWAAADEGTDSAARALGGANTFRADVYTNGGRRWPSGGSGGCGDVVRLWCVINGIYTTYVWYIYRNHTHMYVWYAYIFMYVYHVHTYGIYTSVCIW